MTKLYVVRGVEDIFEITFDRARAIECAKHPMLFIEEWERTDDSLDFEDKGILYDTN